jgi:hypothetical protein
MGPGHHKCDFTERLNPGVSDRVEVFAYAVSPSVLRQVDVHVQQVIERATRSRQTPFAGGLVESLKSAVGKLQGYAP